MSGDVKVEQDEASPEARVAASLADAQAGRQQQAYELANPQWTPLEDQAPAWMRLGFAIFKTLEGRSRTLEVFPSASYRMLDKENGVRVETPLAGFLPGPKDMLDAIAAAVTGVEFLAGRGQEVGDGDGLGTIVIPRPLPGAMSDVLKWPG